VRVHYAGSGQAADAAAGTLGGAQAGDFVVLGGEAGQGLSAEAVEFADRAGRLGESFLQRGDLVLEPHDLGVTRIGSFADLLECLKSLLEFGAQVRVGAGAVEGGAVNSGFAG
jgi:hypothetical protein